MPQIPYPPLELANRVGSLEAAADPFELYDALGSRAKRDIVSLLPRDWSFDGKRVLDFGCGAGRTLRHFVAEAASAQFHGCDIDESSIAWLEQHASPPFNVFVNGEVPPLAVPADSFDLVYAISVFTHLTDTWSAWLLELHRVLADDGILIATFIGAHAAHWVTDAPWDDAATGMNVLKPGQRWELGGPMVLHSPWWIRAHWGRAFEILELRPGGFATDSAEGQGAVVMKKRPVTLSVEELERLEPNEPREALAASRNTRQLVRELIELRASHDQLAAAWQGEQAARARAEESAARLCDELERLRTSTDQGRRLLRRLRA